MKCPIVVGIVLLAVGLVIFSTWSSTGRTDLTVLPSPRKLRNPTPPDFWNSARIPDPGHDLPITPIRPEDLGVIPPSGQIDHPTRIAFAISRNDLPAIQSAALSWFEQDPVAARDWLAMQPTFDDLQPAISYIASKVSENGELKTALEWAALLPEGTLRHDTVFDIYAFALRNGSITASQINLNELPPERQAEILSGAAGD